jgi:hypothetical protein
MTQLDITGLNQAIIRISDLLPEIEELSIDKDVQTTLKENLILVRDNCRICKGLASKPLCDISLNDLKRMQNLMGNNRAILQYININLALLGLIPL